MDEIGEHAAAAERQLLKGRVFGRAVILMSEWVFPYRVGVRGIEGAVIRGSSPPTRAKALNDAGRSDISVRMFLELQAVVIGEVCHWRKLLVKEKFDGSFFDLGLTGIAKPRCYVN